MAWVREPTAAGAWAPEPAPTELVDRLTDEGAVRLTDDGFHRVVQGGPTEWTGEAPSETTWVVEGV